MWLALALLMPSLVVAGCGVTETVRAQRPEESAESGALERDRKPLQIGKLIKKRQIAPVMSVAHADWLTRPERDSQEQPDRVVAELKIPAGATVVDLGAGVGYFTWRLAKQVGPSGKVIAVDIQEGMLDLLRQNLADRDITNTEVVLGGPDDPHLPVGAVDLVLLVDVYHELAAPEKIMEHVRRSLKPDGRVAIIEYRKEDPNIPISPLHKMTVAEVRAEVEPVGFRLAEVLDFLPTQHIIIFKDGKGAKR
jgi:predicted methyltransferase